MPSTNLSALFISDNLIHNNLISFIIVPLIFTDEGNRGIGGKTALPKSIKLGF